jgi:hypothetical protein
MHGHDKQAFRPAGVIFAWQIADRKPNGSTLKTASNEALFMKPSAYPERIPFVQNVMKCN